MGHFLVLVSVIVAAIVHLVGARVVIGNEILRNTSFSVLKGETVAILTNPSGLFPDSLQHIVDYLHFDTNTNISVILAPEHGFRGDHQAESGDPDSYIDAATNLTVQSVYRKNQSDIQRILTASNTTVLLVDIQDVGTRLYTFVWTMFDVLNAIAAMQPQDENSPSIKIIVLDRPNPVGGVAVEGPILNTTCCSSRYGKSAVTHRHGLTIGELALLFDAQDFNSVLQRNHVRVTRFAPFVLVCAFTFGVCAVCAVLGAHSCKNAKLGA